MDDTRKQPATPSTKEEILLAIEKLKATEREKRKADPAAYAARARVHREPDHELTRVPASDKNDAEKYRVSAYRESDYFAVRAESVLRNCGGQRHTSDALIDPLTGRPIDNFWQGNSGGPAPGKRMTQLEAKTWAEDHCARNPFPGVNALAKIVREVTGRTCSSSTMSKAVNRSKKLRAMLVECDARRKSVSAKAMTEGAAASTKQTREPDPIDSASASTDDLFHRLVEQAKPSERAKLNAMTPARRRELVAMWQDDPDSGHRVRGRSR